MVVSRSSKNQPLKATYDMVQNPVFQDAVIETLISIAEVVPDGMLVFLPSYGILNKLVSRWERTSMVFKSSTCSCCLYLPFYPLEENDCTDSWAHIFRVSVATYLVCLILSQSICASFRRCIEDESRVCFQGHCWRLGRSSLYGQNHRVVLLRT